MVDDSPTQEAMAPDGTPSAEAAQARGPEVEELRRQRDETHDRLLRALADAENARRRAQREREEFVKYANESLLRDPRRSPKRDRPRAEEGVPTARDAVPPRPQPGRQGRRGSLQGGQRGVRRPVRPRKARALRPVRHGGFHGGRGVHGHGLRDAVRRHLRELLLGWLALEPSLPRLARRGP